MTETQLAIALAKVWNGYNPWHEGWSSEDTEAVEYALGHPIDTKPPKLKPRHAPYPGEY